MITVYTEEELKRAFANKEGKIICQGKLAEKLQRKRRVRKNLKCGGVLLALAGIAAIPFTGGTSAVATAVGVSALTIGTVTISAVELAIILGFALAAYGIHKNCKVKFNKDGSVEIYPQYD